MEYVKMLFNKVLIQPDAVKETSTLQVVRTSEPTPESGVVIAVGPGALTSDGTLVPMSVKVGDKVRFMRHGYDEWKDGEVTYLIMPETNILLVSHVA